MTPVKHKVDIPRQLELSAIDFSKKLRQISSLESTIKQSIEESVMAGNDPAPVAHFG